MVSVGRHENIELLTCSEVESVSGYVGNYHVHVRQNARYVDESMCTGCEQCADVCPVEVNNAFDLGLSTRKAVYRNSAQATPNAFAIDKLGTAPCRDACPADQRAMGYLALVKQKRYADAYWVIRRENPFPSVCGRVCSHVCEDACSRGMYDEPVNIMGVKRFVADWAYEHRDEIAQMEDKSVIGTPFSKEPILTGQKVAVIGSGPAGLTAGLDLVRLGHQVKVFENFSEPGGMMRVGIPPHRLPYDRLRWEIGQIEAEGVEIQLNTRIQALSELEKAGFDAVLIATGVHDAIKLSIPHAAHPDNWLSVDFLRRVLLGEEIDLSGRRVIVLGAGDVALDVARTAVRLGQPEVKIVCRGMRASEHEINAAVEEGVEIIPSRVFKEVVVEGEQIAGMQCLMAEVGGIVDGRRQVQELPNTEHVIAGDLVIWALGQTPDYSFIDEGSPVVLKEWRGIEVDENLMTGQMGVFVAGDAKEGQTSFVVDAIGEGHHAARCIDRYLRKEAGLPEPVVTQPVAYLEKEEIEAKIANGTASNQARQHGTSIPAGERVNNFSEVDVALTEEQVLAEAARCLECGVCAECMECVVACEKGAIDHQMTEQIHDLKVGAIILATGFQSFDPVRAPEYGAHLPNVLTALEFERLINPSGPTNGMVLMKNGQPPKSVAVLHCVGQPGRQI